VQSIIYQDLWTDIHRQYIFDVADSLPEEVLQDITVCGLLEKWSRLKDETVLAILGAGSA
jgi:hypothetical protein